MQIIVFELNYITEQLGATLEYDILGAMLIGTIIGALLGAFVNRNLKDQWLQMALGTIVLLIGLKYILG